MDRLHDIECTNIQKVEEKSELCRILDNIDKSESNHGFNHANFHTIPGISEMPETIKALDMSPNAVISNCDTVMSEEGSFYNFFHSVFVYCTT